MSASEIKLFFYSGNILYSHIHNVLTILNNRGTRTWNSLLTLLPDFLESPHYSDWFLYLAFGPGLDMNSVFKEGETRFFWVGLAASDKLELTGGDVGVMYSNKLGCGRTGGEGCHCKTPGRSSHYSLLWSNLAKPLPPQKLQSVIRRDAPDWSPKNKESISQASNCSVPLVFSRVLK